MGFKIQGAIFIFICYFINRLVFFSLDFLYEEFKLDFEPVDVSLTHFYVLKPSIKSILNSVSVNTIAINIY